MNWYWINILVIVMNLVLAAFNFALWGRYDTKSNLVMGVIAIAIAFFYAVVLL